MASKRADGSRGVDTERILDIAAEIFAVQGYLGTNLGDVADQLGVTRQALYHHFPKKHDILLAIFERLFDELEAGADEIEASPSTESRFENLVRSHVHFVATHPSLASISLLEHRHLPRGAAEMVLKRRESYLERFENAFADGVKSGQLVDENPRVAVQLVHGAANWMCRWYKPSGALGPDAMTDLIFELLMKGLSAADQPDGRARRR